MLKAEAFFLSNPFCVLGISCNAQNADIIKAQEKISKLSKLGAEKSYKTEYYNNRLPEIDRSSGIIQTAVSGIDNAAYKLFWYETPEYLKRYGDEGLLSEFNQNNIKDITYEKFLSIYLYLLLEDSAIEKTAVWDKLFQIISFYLALPYESLSKLMQNRNIANVKDIFSNNILKPVKSLCDESNIDINIKILNALYKYNIKIINDLRNEILEEIVIKIEDQLSFIMYFENSIDNFKSVTEEQMQLSIKAINNIKELCLHSVSPLLETPLNDFVLVDRIKDLIYSETNKLANIFANGKDFTSAYDCLATANKFVPTYKQSEVKELLGTFKVLKEGVEAVKAKREQGLLDYEDEKLLNHKDVAIQGLFLRAMSGDSQSQCILGNIYKTPAYDRNAPIDISYNLSKAIIWIRKSAEQGDKDGLLALGMCYFTGEGVGQDLTTADHYIQRAKSMGNNEAITITTDYRYSSIVSKAKKESYAWVWWIIGIIVFIVMIASNS